MACWFWCVFFWRVLIFYDFEDGLCYVETCAMLIFVFFCVAILVIETTYNMFYPNSSFCSISTDLCTKIEVQWQPST